MVSTCLFPLLVHMEQLQRLFLGFQVVVSTSVSHFIRDPKHTEDDPGNIHALSELQS